MHTIQPLALSFTLCISRFYHWWHRHHNFCLQIWKLWWLDIVWLLMSWFTCLELALLQCACVLRGWEAECTGTLGHFWITFCNEVPCFPVLHLRAQFASLQAHYTFFILCLVYVGVISITFHTYIVLNCNIFNKSIQWMKIVLFLNMWLSSALNISFVFFSSSSPYYFSCGFSIIPFNGLINNKPAPLLPFYNYCSSWDIIS